MSIFNYFGETLSWDIFTQGLFFSFILYLGGYLIYITQIFRNKEEIENREKKNEKRWDKEQSYLKRYWSNLRHSIKDLPNKKLDLKHAIITFSPFVRSFIRFKLILFPLALVLTFTIGILVHTIADSWIDKDNYTHLGLKGYWAKDFENEYLELDSRYQHCDKSDHIPKESFKDYKRTDAGIKLDAFDNIFRKHQNVCPQIKLQIYYYIKHKLLAEDQWRGYISYSQVLINLTQGIALSFFFLLLLSLTNFCIYILRKRYLISTFILGLSILLYLFPLSFPKVLLFKEGLVCIIVITGLLNLVLYKKRKILINLSFILFSIAGYWLSSKAWLNYEYEVCHKTYGVYKIIDEKLDYNEIEYLYEGRDTVSVED